MADHERHRMGEDGHITIARQRERCRNLKDDYGTTNAAPAGHAAHSPSSLGTRGGCAVLAPHLRMVVWPPKFWAHLLEKCDGTINPTDFLHIYTTTILVAGGNEVIMANYFPVPLTGTTQLWLMILPLGSL
jgi:hypothetical protein